VGCAQFVLLAGLVANCQTDDGDYVFGGASGGSAGSAGSAASAGRGNSGDQSASSGGGSANAGRGGSNATGGATAVGSGGGDAGAESGGDAGAVSSGGAPLTGQGGTVGEEPPAPPGIGTPCSDDGECSDAACVDGVCCDSACTEPCHACAGALTGKADGTCAPALAGEDPRDDCDDATGSDPCGNDGACNGEGECRNVGSGQVCGEASCSGRTFTPAATCDGAGACGTPTAEDCGQYPCAATGCLKSCTQQSDCSETSYCNLATGTCAAKNPNGTAASQGYECQSGIVADGVCCNMECSGCKACSGSPLTSGLAGNCLNVVAGEDAHDFCTDSGDACGNDGACDGAGACRSTPRQGEPCSTNASNLCLVGGTCDDGECTGVTTKTCAASATACRQPGVCEPSTGACTYEPASSGTCNDGNACTSNDSCVSGTCMGTAMACTTPPACRTAVAAACSGGTCSYPTNLSDGSTDAKCNSNTPRCFGGACVECTSNAHCASKAPKVSCNTSTHACVCRLKSTGNLLTNPGFDSWTSGWPTGWGKHFGTASEERQADSEACPDSSSLYTWSGGPTQCVRVGSRQAYNAGGYFAGGSGGGGIYVSFFSNTNCAENGLLEMINLGFPTSATAGFKKHLAPVESPMGAQSVLFELEGTAWVSDRLFFGLATALTDF
jgi:hypothetical protein